MIAGGARLALSILAAALTLSLGCGSPPFHGFVVDPPTPASALRLPDGAGGQFDLKDERSRAVLVYFGYTCCPDICPRTLSTWAQARRLLGPKADGVRFVFVSVDPDRDSPARTREFAQRFDPHFLGLSGAPEQIDPILRAWRQAPLRTAGGGSAAYQVTHSGGGYLIDRRGRLRVVYPRDVAAGDLASDLARIR